MGSRATIALRKEQRLRRWLTAQNKDLRRRIGVLENEVIRLKKIKATEIGRFNVKQKGGIDDAIRGDAAAR